MGALYLIGLLQRNWPMAQSLDILVVSVDLGPHNMSLARKQAALCGALSLMQHYTLKKRSKTLRTFCILFMEGLHNTIPIVTGLTTLLCLAMVLPLYLVDGATMPSCTLPCTVRWS